MQFVINGPDIPDRLLQAHEDGRVVFFCGAGISYPAGLPGFDGLVKKLYDELTPIPNHVQQAAIKSKQFDTAVDLLENDVVGERETVRRELAKILQPDFSKKNALRTHESLLKLSKNRDGQTRLITTNFDRLFEEVISSKKLNIERFHAPLLPIPKNRWDGLVYLHGLLTMEPTQSDLNRLVLSSGDFGLAYLIERWAARFVSELFRNYTICFVGYSINDPVMRYMMDALAADRQLGESPSEMFAFGSYSKGKADERANEWLAKKVTPILYQEYNRHTYLHKSLATWADTWIDGTLGKERIVVNCAIARPSASTKQDNFVGRMLWALSDKSGLPAKHFAELNPVPPLEWLEAFSENRFQHSDLARFGVAPVLKVDHELSFSLISRPASYIKSPRMNLVSNGSNTSEWDNVMPHLGAWLVRHLNNSKLIVWLAERGGKLHDRFSSLLEEQLNRIAKLEHEGNTSELDSIKNNAPNAIPSSLMRKLWRLLLTGRVKFNGSSLELYRWRNSLRRDGLTTTLRLELRELLAPKIRLREPFRFVGETQEMDSPIRMRQLVDWELVLASDSARSALRDNVLQQALPNLLEEFQQLLCDALDLQLELSDTDSQSDQSYRSLPSISPHRQNRRLRDWIFLIELLRDTWLPTQISDPVRAARIAEYWFDLPYPTFKRLALFAASHNNCIAPELWVDWLLVDDARWLWSVETKREVMRLLVLQGSNLSSEAQKKLEDGIILGPPRDMYQAYESDDNGWQDLVDHAVWLRLIKLKVSGATLGSIANQHVIHLSTIHPKWEIATNERDEFSSWMSSSSDPDYQPNREIDIAPRKRSELVTWLKRPAVQPSPRYEDTWSETCRERFFHTLFALNDLAQDQLWPTNRWQAALQVWSENSRIDRSWRFVAEAVENMPDDVVRQIISSVARWLAAASEVIHQHELVLFTLCKRILGFPFENIIDVAQDRNLINSPFTEAINHPIGHVTQALLNLWFIREPNDNEKLSPDIEELFTAISNIHVEHFRHGRVLLAANLVSLFRVDPEWTEKNLLWQLDWQQNPIEAKATWEGFLWSPRFYRPLLISFKTHLLDTAHHYEELDEHKQEYASFITYAALESLEVSTQDFHIAIKALPQEGLEEVAQSLLNALEGAGDLRAGYWKNHIQPFWKKIWPKSRNFVSEPIAQLVAQLCIASDTEFPSALREIENWLLPIEYPDYVVNQLHESGLCSQFPFDVLKLLNAIIYNQQSIPLELKNCLDAIAQADPTLVQNNYYVKLNEYSRKRTF